MSVVTSISPVEATADSPVVERVGLEGTGNRNIWEISGGQQQRVAIARALAAETPLFLGDEPFAALDALARERLQDDVRQVSAESGRTMVFVTHSAGRSRLTVEQPAAVDGGVAVVDTDGHL